MKCALRSAGLAVAGESLNPANLFGSRRSRDTSLYDQTALTFPNVRHDRVHLTDTWQGQISPKDQKYNKIKIKPPFSWSSNFHCCKKIGRFLSEVFCDIKFSLSLYGKTRLFQSRLTLYTLWFRLIFEFLLATNHKIFDLDPNCQLWWVA